MVAIRTGMANHIELVFRPGEALLACKLLDLLECEPISQTTPFAGVYFHLTKDQCLFASEVTDEQWAFEKWLQNQLETQGSTESAAFIRKLHTIPQRHAHFGLGVASLDRWERIVARLRAAAENDPELRGRIELPFVRRPEDQGSVFQESGGKLGKTLYQAFVRTDILSTGLLTLGQAIEVQHYRENDPAFNGALTPKEAAPT